MMYRVDFRVIVIVVILMHLINPVGAVSIIKSQNPDTCYDYSMNYSELNPDWKVLAMSDNKFFLGSCHYCNYRYVDKDVIEIHDGLYDMNYTFVGWQLSGYYHFWMNETPVRNYCRLYDNRNAVLNK